MRPQVITTNNNTNANNNNNNNNNTHNNNNSTNITPTKIEFPKETSELYYLKRNPSSSSTFSNQSSSIVVGANANNATQRIKQNQSPINFNSFKNQTNGNSTLKSIQLNGTQIETNKNQIDTLLDSKKAREAFFERLRFTENLKAKTIAAANVPTPEKTTSNRSETPDSQRFNNNKPKINNASASNNNNNGIYENNLIKLKENEKTDNNNNNSFTANNNYFVNSYQSSAKPFNLKSNFANVVKIDVKFKSESSEKMEPNGNKSIAYLLNNQNTNSGNLSNESNNGSSMVENKMINLAYYNGGDKLKQDIYSQIKFSNIKKPMDEALQSINNKLSMIENNSIYKVENNSDEPSSIKVNNTNSSSLNRSASYKDNIKSLLIRRNSLNNDALNKKKMLEKQAISEQPESKNLELNENYNMETPSKGKFFLSKFLLQKGKEIFYDI